MCKLFKKYLDINNNFAQYIIKQNNPFIFVSHKFDSQYISRSVLVK